MVVRWQQLVRYLDVGQGLMVGLAGSRFADLSEYELRHLAEHLLEAKRFQELHSLVRHYSWYQARRERNPSASTFAHDLELALQAAESQGPAALVDAVRHTLCYATLRTLATNVPPKLLSVLANLGQSNQASDYARMMPELGIRDRADSLIAAGEARAAEGYKDEARRELALAFYAAQQIEDQEEASYATWPRMAEAMAAAGDIDGALRAIASIGVESMREDAAHRVLHELARTGNQQKAFEVVAAAETGRRDGLLSYYSDCLNSQGRFADSIDTALMIESDTWRTRTVGHIASSMWLSEEWLAKRVDSLRAESDEERARARHELEQAIAQTAAAQASIGAALESDNAAKDRIACLVWLGRSEQAMADADAAGLRSYYMCELATRAARRGEFADALAIVNAIPGTSYADWEARYTAQQEVQEMARAAEGVPTYLSGLTNPAAVLEPARRAEDRWARNKTLSLLAYKLIASGDIDAVTQAVAAIDNTWLQQNVLLELAGDLVSSGHLETLVALAKEAMTPPDVYNCLARIAERLAIVDRPSALALLDCALVDADQLKEDLALSRIRPALAAALRDEGLWEQSMEMLRGIPLGWDNALVWAVVVALYRAGLVAARILALFLNLVMIGFLSPAFFVVWALAQVLRLVVFPLLSRYWPAGARRLRQRILAVITVGEELLGTGSRSAAQAMPFDDIMTRLREARAKGRDAALDAIVSTIPAILSLTEASQRVDTAWRLLAEITEQESWWHRPPSHCCVH